MSTSCILENEIRRIPGSDVPGREKGHTRFVPGHPVVPLCVLYLIHGWWWCPPKRIANAVSYIIRERTRVVVVVHLSLFIPCLCAATPLTRRRRRRPPYNPERAKDGFFFNTSCYEYYINACIVSAEKHRHICCCWHRHTRAHENNKER